MWALQGGRVAIAAQALGIGQAALDAAIAHAKQREQFGQPIANYQAIQWMLADMATELEAARMLTLKAAAAKDTQEKSAVEASMAKLAASEAAHKAADKAMQILASAGYRRGSVVERLFRDVRATEIYQGTSEAQRMIIAASVLANA
jgi:alkylation response protein AidB-like acyl-CoA dehydrogenase